MALDSVGTATVALRSSAMSSVPDTTMRKYTASTMSVTNTNTALANFENGGRLLIETGSGTYLNLLNIKAGTLRMPDGPRALFNLYAPADSVDQATGLARGTTRLEVVYTPYATMESTGLPTRPGNGLPWLMYPGKPWANIMVMQ